jgi:cytochrome c-type biogenesis protein CcmH/NrfG
MSKKLLIGIVIAAILLIGGYVGFRVYQTQQAEKAYQDYSQSSTKIADDLMKTLVAQDLDGAKKLFAKSFQDTYSDAFWKDTFFPTFKNFKGTPTKVSQKSAATAPDGRPAYNPDLHQDPQEYLYDFKLGDVTYRVRTVIAKDPQSSNGWKVNELTGVYR